ncbi:MAG: hypothetical protein ACK55O_15795 [Phycisphaerales bacterium]|jgi:indole-3-glycerol phosphate synthase/phosphoribosylanthranilate isomerase|nr:hypothetical protein [Phycisphaeraceae bacterium]
MADLLSDMARSSRARCESARFAESLDSLRARVLSMSPPPPVRDEPFVLIAEVKRSSPSMGTLSADTDALAFVGEQARRYESGGASIISVLTEPTRFSGDLSHLNRVAQSVSIPVMRKDFLVDPYQVYEARAHGAGGVLLIARMLDDDTMIAMLDAAGQCGMFTLIEAFDEQDIDRMSAIVRKRSLRAPVMLGLNTRDLSTLAIDMSALERLRPRFPDGFRVIAESGIETERDAGNAAASGYGGALVGTSLMRSDDPAALCRAMKQAGAAATPAGGSPGVADRRVRIKICGVMSETIAQVCVDAGADAIGFVFAPSPRRVEPSLAAAIASNVPRLVSCVGVFKRPELAEVHHAVDPHGPISLLQMDVESLHGPADRFGVFTDRVVPVVRVPSSAYESLERGSPIEAIARGSARPGFILIEGERSGVGQTVDWNRLRPVCAARRVMLAGGLHPENVREAIRSARPFAVDVSSGVETAPGVKDASKIRDFIGAVRAACEELSKEHQS